MDPVSLILAALLAGATAAAKDTVTAAVKDAYDGLKHLVMKRFKRTSHAETALTEFKKHPAAWQKPLGEALTNSGAAGDPGIVQQATRVLQLVEPQQFNQGKYNVQLTGDVQGRVIGDHAQQSNIFGARTPKA